MPCGCTWRLVILIAVMSNYPPVAKQVVDWIEEHLLRPFRDNVYCGVSFEVLEEASATDAVLIFAWLGPAIKAKQPPKSGYS